MDRSRSNRPAIVARRLPPMLEATDLAMPTLAMRDQGRSTAQGAVVPIEAAIDTVALDPGAAGRTSLPAIVGRPATRRPAKAAHGPKSKPDPWPVRLALGAGGLAFLSAVAAAIVAPPAPIVTASAPAPSTSTAAASPATVAVRRQVRYVHLLPGQTAPPGATVIDAKARQPITIVTKVAAPAQRPIVLRTTQSGRVIP